MVDEDRREGAASASSIEINSSTTTEAPSKSLLRIVHQNVNGISADVNFNQVGLLLSQVQKQDIEILAMDEINVNLANKSVRSQYLKSFHDKHSQCATQPAWAPTNITASKYRPGGNQVAIFGTAWSLIKEKKYDKIAGSWSLITIATMKGMLTIISAYRVSQNALANLGPMTVYSQEHMAFQASIVAKAEPRKRCLIELERVVKGEMNKGHMVLVNIDANDYIQANTAVQTFCDNTSLIDLIARFSPSQVNTPTYARGKKRIDYSFCSPNLLEFVISASIKASASVRTGSDHTALESR
jgi:exonuclease III